MSIKVLLLDMDGTTLEKNQVTISKRNMEAIGRAIEKGIHVIPCTGRVLDMYPPQLLKICLPCSSWHPPSNGLTASARICPFCCWPGIWTRWAIMEKG